MDHSFLSLPSSPISPSSASNNNHFILFLNSNAINKQSSPRDLFDVFHSTNILSKSKKLHYHLPTIKSIENHLMLNGEKHKEVREHVERLWASIFSYPLQTDHVNMLRKCATGVYTKECCTCPMCKKECCMHAGSLLCDYKKTFFFKKLKGDTNANTNAIANKAQKNDIDFSKLRVTLVMSHCKENLS